MSNIINEIHTFFRKYLSNIKLYYEESHVLILIFNDTLVYLLREIMSSKFIFKITSFHQK